MNEEGYALLQSKYVAEREKVEKLEGWLKYLWVLYWQEHDGELLGAVENKEIDAEISDYIKEIPKD